MTNKQRRKVGNADVFWIRSVTATREALLKQLGELPTQREMADRLGISQSTVKKIALGYVYKDRDLVLLSTRAA